MPPLERVPALSAPDVTPDDHSTLPAGAAEAPDTPAPAVTVGDPGAPGAPGTDGEVDGDDWGDDEEWDEEAVLAAEAEYERALVEQAAALAAVPANPPLDPLDAAALDAACDRLANATMTPLAQIVDASNGVLLVRLEDEHGVLHGVYKPQVGERPLWDFPLGTLAQREVATYLVSRAAGLGVVPPTVLRDGTHGVGSVQWWVSADATAPAPVDLVAPADARPGHVAVLQAQTQEGDPLLVVHRDHDDVRAAALLDAVVNNADRKGSALLTDGDGHVWGIDHGICLHEDPKLRTILWGWAGEPFTDAERATLAGLAADLGGGALEDGLAALLAPAEVDALRARVHDLLDAGAWPMPPTDRHAIPWPVL